MAHFSAIKAAPKPPEIARCSPRPPPRPNPPACPRPASTASRPISRTATSMPAGFQAPSCWSIAAARWSTDAVQGFADVERKAPMQGRHHFSHLFDDQADHQRRLHDAVRGRPRRARRARPQIHPGMEEPRRVPGRHRAGIPDQAAVAADADRRPAAAHFRADLRLPAALQCRCRLSRKEDRRGRESGHAADR